MKSNLVVDGKGDLEEKKVGQWMNGANREDGDNQKIPKAASGCDQTVAFSPNTAGSLLSAFDTSYPPSYTDKAIL